MHRLREQQLNARIEKGLVILKACPGSGKTYTIAEKIIDELENWKYRNKGVAILSFTNVACDEINDKVKQINNNINIEYPHYLGTIDSFINKYIFLPFAHLLPDFNKRPNIVGYEGFPWIQNGKWSWGKGNNECYKNNCKLLDFSYDINGNLININPKAEVQKCKKSYSVCLNLKKKFTKENYATQADANYYAMKILKQFPFIANILSKKFEMIILDEAQDTSNIQMKIIDLLIEGGIRNVFMVGDPDQCIYEFRKAEPEVFIQKTKDKRFKIHRLTYNKRCSQKICDATNAFAGTLEAAVTSISEHKDFHFYPQLIGYNDLQSLKRYFFKICSDNDIEINEKNVAILVRNRSQLKKLLEIKIPSNFIPWKDEDIITPLFAKATFLRDSGKIRESVKYLNSALSIILFGENLNKSELDKKINEISNIYQWKILIWNILINLPKSDLILREWIKESNNFFKRNELYDGKIIKLNIKSRSTKYKEFSEQPLKFYFDKNDKELDCTITTIHSAKGKTYDAVMIVIPKNGKGTVNQIDTSPLNNEEVRVAYVGMTRPKKILIVAIPKAKKRKITRFKQGVWDIRDLEI